MTIHSIAIALEAGTIPAPIYVGNAVSQVSWAADSSSFAFSSGLTTGAWYKYDLTSRKLIQANEWPFYPKLMASESQIFNFAANDDSYKPLVFSSPDGRFLVSVQDKAESGVWPLVLADPIDKQVRKLSSSVISPFKVDDFNVLWNRTSSAFTVMTTPDEGGTGYPVLTAFVTHFRDQLLSAVTTDFLNVKVANIGYTLIAVFAISDSGNQILVSLKDMNSGDQNTHLALLDVVNPSQSQIVFEPENQNILSAAYSPKDERHLLIIDNDGLINYSLESGTAIVLNKEINSFWARAAYFSPDGKWVAVVHFDETDQI